MCLRERKTEKDDAFEINKDKERNAFQRKTARDRKCVVEEVRERERERERMCFRESKTEKERQRMKDRE